MPKDYPKKIPIINILLYTKIMIHLNSNLFSYKFSHNEQIKIISHSLWSSHWLTKVEVHCAFGAS
jgi:hypothetical protein